MWFGPFDSRININYYMKLHELQVTRQIRQESCSYFPRTVENIKPPSKHLYNSPLVDVSDAVAALLCFTGGQVSKKDTCAKSQPVHILCRCGKDLPCFNQFSTAGLGLARSLQHKTRWVYHPHFLLNWRKKSSFHCRSAGSANPQLTSM